MKNMQSKFWPIPLEEQTANEQMEYDWYSGVIIWNMITVGFIFSILIGRICPCPHAITWHEDNIVGQHSWLLQFYLLPLEKKISVLRRLLSCSLSLIIE